MPSDAAMKVWREALDAHEACAVQSWGADDQAAAEVIERAIADAVAEEMAKAEALAEALRGIDQFGHRHPGHGWSCGELAAAALKAWATPPTPPQ